MDVRQTLIDPLAYELMCAWNNNELQRLGSGNIWFRGYFQRQRRQRAQGKEVKILKKVRPPPRQPKLLDVWKDKYGIKLKREGKVKRPEHLLVLARRTAERAHRFYLRQQLIEALEWSRFRRPCLRTGVRVERLLCMELKHAA